MLLSPLIIALGLAAAEPPTDPVTPPPTATIASPPLIEHPKFVDVPTVPQFMTYYPETARRRGIAGKVVIECKVLPSGELTDCKVLSETPTGYQFGEKALQLSVYFRLRKSEVPCPDNVCGIVRIPVKYNVAP